MSIIGRVFRRLFRSRESVDTTPVDLCLGCGSPSLVVELGEPMLEEGTVDTEWVEVTKKCGVCGNVREVHLDQLLCILKKPQNT